MSASDVETLLKRVCRTRFEQRREIERRASAASIAWIAEEETAQLQALDEPQLPSVSAHDLGSRETADLPGLSFDFSEVDVDESTLRAQLDEVGLRSTELCGDASGTVEGHVPLVYRASEPARPAPTPAPVLEVPAAEAIEPRTVARRNWVIGTSVLALLLIGFALALPRGESESRPAPRIEPRGLRR